MKIDVTKKFEKCSPAEQRYRVDCMCRAIVNDGIPTHESLYRYNVPPDQVRSRFAQWLRRDATRNSALAIFTRLADENDQRERARYEDVSPTRYATTRDDAIVWRRGVIDRAREDAATWRRGVIDRARAERDARGARR